MYASLVANKEMDAVKAAIESGEQAKLPSSLLYFSDRAELLDIVHACGNGFTDAIRVCFRPKTTSELLIEAQRDIVSKLSTIRIWQRRS